MMSSRLLLLVLAALAACLRSGRAQGDPLPPSLVDLVMNSPISSVDDLKRLLDVESVEEDDEIPESEMHSNGTHKRLPRSLNVQVAQQAMCKVRTEVMEVTRAMLDRRNANFLLWPPCVEVQRCSGCCNTRTVQCMPVTIETRQLQMTKIQYINRQPVYEKVVIPVEDHLTCSCQSRVLALSPRLLTTPLPPPRLHPKVTLPKTQSKEELHRHDELKHNQRLHLEDKESQELQWQSKNTVTHTQGYRQSPYRHTLTHTAVHVSGGDVPTRQTTLGDPHMMSDATQTEEVKSEHSGDSMAKKTQQHYDKHLQEDQQAEPRQPQDKTTPQQPKYNASHNPVQSGHSMPHSSQLDTFSTYSHVEKLENITTTNQKQIIQISRKGSSSQKHNIIFVTKTTDTISFTNIQRKQSAINRLAHKKQCRALLPPPPQPHRLRPLSSPRGSDGGNIGRG
ncbi:platelet-derived growth factor subunit A [Pimephales promelas]|nr:platelet-derived growth factor subunit A [Pimephales promelas]